MPLSGPTLASRIVEQGCAGAVMLIPKKLGDHHWLKKKKESI